MKVGGSRGVPAHALQTLTARTRPLALSSLLPVTEDPGGYPGEPWQMIDAGSV